MRGWGAGGALLLVDRMEFDEFVLLQTISTGVWLVGICYVSLPAEGFHTVVV